MKAVSDELFETISELLGLKSLSKFSLGGGTNLAIRYNHRISIDIDLFCSEIIGKAGFEEIVRDIKTFYGNDVFGCDFPCDISDQYIFLRFFVRKNEIVIKVEVLQNFRMLNPPEVLRGIRLLSEQDIGMLKLMSLSNRASKKDVYDLEYLTQNIPLPELYDALKRKQELFNTVDDQTIFDLDKEQSPVGKPELLLKFDSPSNTGNRSKPSHTHDRIFIVEGKKSWTVARSAWRRKVRLLFNHLSFSFPDTEGIDI